jgi:hypothetical protein
MRPARSNLTGTQRTKYREADNKSRKLRAAKDPEYYRKEHHFRRYGITLEQRAVIIARQDYKCAVCTTGLRLSGRATNSAHLDHDHGTGRVRGILCSACNKALGLFKDSVVTIENAAIYLKKHNSLN